MQASACATRARYCARCVLCWPAFPSASTPRFTGSAAEVKCSLANVRRLHSYDGGARLLVSVHHRRPLLVFPTRTAVVRQRVTVRHEISQVPTHSLNARDVALDPGGATMPRIAALHMLRSTIRQPPLPPFHYFAAHSHTPPTAVYASCSASPPPHATLASRWLARALPSPDLHRLIAPALPGAFLHSITSSARASSSADCEAKVFRCLRLMTSSNWSVG